MFYGLLIVIACGLVVFFKMKSKANPAPQVRNAPHQSSSSQKPARRTSASTDDDDNDESDDSQADSWVAWRHKVGTFPRPAGMVVLPGMAKVILKGTAARVKELKPFIDAMRTDRPSFSSRLERETSNTYDQNAIRIWGTASRGGEVNLGYVPAESAKVIAETYKSDMPIIVEMVSCGYTVTQEAAYVKVRLIGPNAAERKKFLKK